MEYQVVLFGSILTNYKNMWGIGIKKETITNIDWISVKDQIAKEDNTFDTHLIIFGLKFKIFHRHYKRNIEMPGKNDSVGFK